MNYGGTVKSAILPAEDGHHTREARPPPVHPAFGNRASGSNVSKNVRARQPYYESCGSSQGFMMASPLAEPQLPVCDDPPRARRGEADVGALHARMTRPMRLSQSSHRSATAAAFDGF